MENRLHKIMATGRVIFGFLLLAPKFAWRLFTLIPFFLLLAVLLVTEPIRAISSWRVSAPLTRLLSAPLSAVYNKILSLLNSKQGSGMTQQDLIILAMSHLKVKKIRSLITIGGMSIGFGSVIFLLSLGYGFQKLVVSRVATLGEMKHIDVTTSQASSLVFDDNTIMEFANLEKVDAVLPMISTVSKVTYNSSVSDIVAYGVTTRFLEESAVQPVRGTFFKDEDFKVSKKKVDEGEVAGVAVEMLSGARLGNELHKVKYAINPQVWQAVYEHPSTTSRILGYTKRGVGIEQAREVWGTTYDHTGTALVGTDNQDNIYNTWISDTFFLWRKEQCTISNYDCVDLSYVVERGSSGQLSMPGYILQNDVWVERYGKVVVSASNLVEQTSIQEVEFSFPSTDWVSLYSRPAQQDLMIGMFTKPESSFATFKGTLVVGEYYYDTDSWGYIGQNKLNTKLGYWVKTTVPLWSKLDCGVECEYYLTERTEAGEHMMQTVFVRAGDVHIADMEKPRLPMLLDAGQVLGEATASAGLSVATPSAIPASIDLAVLGLTGVVEDLDGIDWAEIASQAGIISQVQQKDTFPLAPEAKRVALVNTAMLNLLGIQHGEAVGKEFQVSFLLDGRLFAKDNYSAESENATYSIIGVLPDERTPSFYVPFGDIQGVGINNYSELKIVAEDTHAVAKIRENIELKGFKSSSVVDTIESINNLFGTLRIVLLLLGMIALGVAALGMFNTLTVSLLEKTREVGLMKTMGMKSSEVERLFLAESVIMGVSGGAFGLLFGYVTGKGLSIILSSFSIANGSGPIDVSYIPLLLAVIIMAFSFVVGVATGWYPAYRATQVSALNALRYE